MKALFDFISKLLAALSHAASDKAGEPDSPAPEKASTVDTVPGWTGEPPYRYLDVSRYQGTIDWTQVAAAGYKGAMLRALGNSASNKPCKAYIDPTFEANYLGAKAAGLDVGAYYYTKALSKAEADRELALLRQVLTGKILTMPVAVDVEDAGLTVLNRQALTDLVAYALHEVEQMGFYAQLYTYTSFAYNRLFMGGAALIPYDVWLADYTGKTPKVDFKYSAHQHTSKGNVPGISGNVDLNVTTRNYPKIICKKGLTRLREGA